MWSSFSYTSRAIAVYEPGFTEIFFSKNGQRRPEFTLEIANKQSQKAVGGKY